MTYGNGVADEVPSRRGGRRRSTRVGSTPTRSKRTAKPLAEAVSELLQAQSSSVNALARALGLSQPFLSRALRRADQKRANADLIERIADQLGVAPDYFLEYRVLRIVEMVTTNPTLADAVFTYIERRSRS